MTAKCKRRNMASSVQISNLKIEDLCRTCLSRDHALYSVFEQYTGAITLDFVITAVTGVKIEENDGLPTTICRECKEKVTKAFDFKKKTQESDATLRGLLRKESNEYSNTRNALYQSGAIGVKTEKLTIEDNNDYFDGDFNMSLENSTEGYDFGETVKNENENVPEFICTHCGLVLETSVKLHEHKKKGCLKGPCIKVEFEDSNGTYCPLCGTCYNDADTLSKHMWANHAEIMGPKKRGRPKKMPTSTILSKLSENGFQIKSVRVKPYNCTFCKDQCKTKEDMDSHIVKKHKDVKIMCCVLCRKMYLKSKNFAEHKCAESSNLNKIEEETTDSSCNKEKQSFITEMFLKDLIDLSGKPSTENINVPQMCSACSGVFLSEEDLIGHNDAEHPELSLRCNLCSKVFASVKIAARHRNICKDIERKHTCTTCGLRFAYEISLNKHILRHHEGQSVSLNFIMEAKAQEEKQFECDTCKKTFIRKDLLAKHARVHIEKLYECDICKRKFNRSDNLRSHKKIHEPNREMNVTKQLCLYCGRGFSNSSNLIVHMRRHTGEKPYKCDFCGKGFPRSSDLQCHRRSHTGEKPCVCGVCGKAFSRSNKLSRHMRVHTGHKPYKCTYCDKAFSQSNDLTLHIRRHTGDKPYICEVCGDRFIQGTALQNHRRAHGHFPPPSTDAQTHPPQVSQGLAYTIENITHN